MPSGIERGLHVLAIEPLVPHRERPVPGDGRVSFERRVERATNSVNGKQSEHRVPATRHRRGGLRNFGSGVLEAGVRQPHGFATIHDLGHSGGAGHEGGVDANAPQDRVAVNAAAEVREPLPETDGGSAGPADGVSAKELGHLGRADPVRGRSVNHRLGNGGLGRNNFGLLGGDLHEHGILEHMHRKVNGLGELPNHFLRKPRHRKREVVDVHLGNDDVGPSGLERIDEIKHKDPEFRSGEPRAGRDASGGDDGPGVDPVHTDGARKSVGRKAELQDDGRVSLELGGFDEHPVRDRLKGLHQVKEGLRMLESP